MTKINGQFRLFRASLNTNGSYDLLQIPFGSIRILESTENAWERARARASVVERFSSWRPFTMLTIYMYFFLPFVSVIRLLPKFFISSFHFMCFAWKCECECECERVYKNNVNKLEWVCIHCTVELCACIIHFKCYT